MKVAVNAISAKVGGAATYIRNVLPDLQQRISPPGERRPGQLVVWRGSTEGEWPEGIEYRQNEGASDRAGALGTLARLWFDQAELPRALRAEGMDVLFSTANFGPMYCPCRQVLLVRNTIYFDETFLQRATVKVRAYYLLQRALVLRSMAAADVVLFPSRAMLDLAAAHAGGARESWGVAHYGTRHDLFHPPAEPRAAGDGPVRLLNVSLYCDQKNLGTLLSAVQSLGAQAPGRYRLDLTAGFERAARVKTAMYPSLEREVGLYRELSAAGLVRDVDWRSYTTLPELYRGADIFVFSSYTESFGHPLVEAMATGLPIVAADIPVNRELCGDAAVYFRTFDPASCGEAIRQVAEDTDLRGRLCAAALERAKTFTWEGHVERLIEAFRGA